MSTRCRIGKLNENGTVTSSYCHHDGYVDGVGEVLVDFYNSDNIDQLLELGDLSSIGENPVSDPEMWKTFSYSAECCLAYNDRGEKTHSRNHESIKDYLNYCDKCGDIEYGYILMNNNWYYCDWTSFSEDDLKLVSDEI